MGDSQDQGTSTANGREGNQVLSTQILILFSFTNPELGTILDNVFADVCKSSFRRV